MRMKQSVKWGEISRMLMQMLKRNITVNVNNNVTCMPLLMLTLLIMLTLLSMLALMCM